MTAIEFLSTKPTPPPVLKARYGPAWTPYILPSKFSYIVPGPVALYTPELEFI